MPRSLLGKQIGNYQVIKLLGEGGMGAVYLGEHPLIGKKVAIKVLHDELARKQEIVSRFFIEAKAVNDIGHEHIVDIVDFGRIQDEGRELVYLVMEFLEGENLRDRMKRGGLTHAEAIHVVVQCADSLAASHRKNIVHRDLKPDNVYLIDRSNDSLFVKLLDFGIAKVQNETPGAHHTRAGSVLGTPAYMSPEQCDGRGNIDHRSDIYALGMLLYEMLCGRVAFVGEGFGEILVAQLTQQPPAPSQFCAQISPELEGVVLRCLEKDRHKRFQTMDELAGALVALRTAMPDLALPAATSSSRHSVVPFTPRRVISAPAMPAPASVLSAVAAPTHPTATPAKTPVNQPTTLSNAASERETATAAHRRPLVWTVLVVMVLGGFGGAYFVMSNQHTNAMMMAPAAATDSAPQSIGTVRVLIDSTPQGAQIMRGGNPIGLTPLTLNLKQGEPAFDVQLELEGYKTTMRSVSSDRDRDIIAALEKAEPPPPSTTMIPPLDTTPPERNRPPRPSPPRGGDKPATSRGSDPDGVLAPSL